MRALGAGELLPGVHHRQDVAARRELDAEALGLHVGELGQRMRAGPDDADDLAARLVLERVEQALRRTAVKSVVLPRRVFLVHDLGVAAACAASASLKAATPSRPKA